MCSGGGIRGALSKAAVAPNASGKAVCKAAASECTKTGSSLSCSSRESQALGRSSVCTHWATRVVLPKPAGAHTRMISPPRAAFKRSMRRVRKMTSLPLRGRESFARIKERREPLVAAVWGIGSVEAAGLAVDSMADPTCACLPASLRAAICRLERLMAREGPSETVKTLPRRVRDALHSDSP